MKLFTFDPMRSISLLLLSALVMGLTACKSDDESLDIQLSRMTLCIEQYDTTAEVGYSTVAAQSVSAVGVPEGWSVEVISDRRVLLVTSPSADDTEAVKSGVATITAYGEESQTLSVSLTLTMEAPVDLNPHYANCMVITEPQKSYSFSPTRRGEAGESFQPVRVELLWQSPGSLLKGVEYLDDHTLTFYVPGDDAGELIPGNALLAAYDDAGEVIWTWHLWFTPTQPASAGRYMDRNLGAAYADPERDQTKILRSYGTYYQWGRMTPFVGPYAYNCASSMDAYMYNEKGRSLYLTYESTTAETGTVEYAISHPMNYLLGVEESAYDWHYDHDNTLWGSGQKSPYDPCPKGWRVADSFEGVAFDDDMEQELSLLEQQFGWFLSVGDATSFFLGAGRRAWFDGLITNVNALETPKPWIGYYWSTQTAEEHTAVSMYFMLNTEIPAASELYTDYPSARANGMQVRCVRDE